MNKILSAVFIAGTTAILGFGLAYTYRQQALLREVDISYAGAKLTKFNFTNSIVKIYLKFINKSSIDVVVENYDFNILINNKLVSKVISPSPGYIAANGESTTELDVKFDPSKVLANVFSKDVLSAVLTDYSKVSVTVKGTISIKHKGIRLSHIPVEVTDNLKNLIYGA